MDRQDLLKRLKGHEWTDVEFKEAQREVPKSAYETVSAFSNTHGGWLAFGIRQMAAGYEVAGIADADKVQGDFPSDHRADHQGERAGSRPHSKVVASCGTPILEETMQGQIPSKFRGWWRIVETSQWVNDGLNLLGPALISLTGTADRLRMHALLAYVFCKPTKSGVSFNWEGAWEFDQVSGSGRVTLGKDGRLRGVIRIKDGDSSKFIAERSVEPDEPIPSPPSYRDKWRRHW
ncbi:MAG: ATP-binding protein [Acidobacteriota bacterium]|jgi:hypothetical protein